MGRARDAKQRVATMSTKGFEQENAVDKMASDTCAGCANKNAHDRYETQNEINFLKI